MSETKKDYEYLHLHWISFMKSYCCGCFTNDTVEVHPSSSITNNVCEGGIGISDTVLVLENNNRELSEIILDEDEFITINESDASETGTNASASASETGASASETGTNVSETGANASETVTGVKTCEIEDTKPVNKADEIEQREESITTIEDKIIAEANDNYF
jgi:hypothetical protein